MSPESWLEQIPARTNRAGLAELLGPLLELPIERDNARLLRFEGGVLYSAYRPTRLDGIKAAHGVARSAQPAAFGPGAHPP